MFQIYFAEVDLDVAYVVMVVHAYFKSIFQMFYLFQLYVANVSSLCSKRRSGVAHVAMRVSGWRTAACRSRLVLLPERHRGPSAKIDKGVRRSTFKYVLHNDELYRRTAEDLLLMCLGSDQAKVAMGEVHEDICGRHQSAPKMKWLLCRADFYWPTMMVDCFRYYKGCKECRKFENIQLVHAAMLHPIIKPWLFRGWGLDFIGQIHPPSSKGHLFVLVATDYFTK
jgi:hypothetical protein